MSATKRADTRTAAIATDAAAVLKEALNSKQQAAGVDKTIKSLAALSSSSSATKNDEPVLANFKSLCQQAKTAVGALRTEGEGAAERATTAEKAVSKVSAELKNVRVSLDESEEEASKSADLVETLTQGLEELKTAAEEGKKEANSQMMAVAKLATQNAGLEAGLEEAEERVSKAEERGKGLKKMNEDLCQMLEDAMTK